MKHLVWEGCYDGGWKGEITPQSFDHPAKFSRALIDRIYDHLLAQGCIKKGDVVGDPFGGVGLGGIIAAYKGLRWVGVELEPRFVEWAKENFELHRYKLKVLDRTMPHIKQGDSRKFNEIVAAIVTSPPYADIAAGAGGLNTKPAKKAGQQSGRNAKSASQTADQRYGKTRGQIAMLRKERLAAVITSPPLRRKHKNRNERREA